MHVFVTGATGLVGTAVVADLLAHGHTVSGLARSDTSAAALERAGATPVRGSVDDLDVLRDAAAPADAAAHLAFDHTAFGSVEAITRAVAQEHAAVAAIGDALAGSDRPFAVTSGTPMTPGRASVERDPLVMEGPLGGRGRTVAAALALADRGVRSSVVRLPRTVHRDGEGGFAGLLTAMARTSGVAGHPGSGDQRWPAVHALDAAALFRLALERAPAGTSWHAVGEEGVGVRATVEVVGRRLGLPVQALPDDAFGPLAGVFVLDQPSSSEHTRTTLGWEPTHVGLLADLEQLQP